MRAAREVVRSISFIKYRDETAVGRAGWVDGRGVDKRLAPRTKRVNGKMRFQRFGNGDQDGTHCLGLGGRE